MSKVISQLLGFSIATLCDWLKNLAQLAQSIRRQTKTIVVSQHVFSRALRRLHVFALSSDWFIGSSMSLVVGRKNNYFSLVLVHLIENRSSGNIKIL